MTAPQTASADTAPNDPCGDRAEGCACCRTAAVARTERVLQVLDGLTELSYALAQAITRQALAHADGQPVVMPLLSGEPARALAQITRSVRQTAALQDRLAEDRQARDKRRDAEAAAAAERERRRGKKVEVKRIVERVIETEAADQFRAEKLLIDLHERLEDQDDTAFADRPIALLIAEICRDLPVYFDRDEWVAEIAASEGACAVAQAEAPSPVAAAATDSPARAPADRATEPSPPRSAAMASDSAAIAVPAPESEESVSEESG
jgi:hypothetical protein